MPRAAALPIWSVDAFLVAHGHNEAVATPEFLSRLDSFVQAYVLYDRVVLTQRYADDPVLQALASHEPAFTFVPAEQLGHSDLLSRGYTLDRAALRLYPELAKENDYWFGEHNPEMAAELRRSPALQQLLARRGGKVDMALLRIWQWGLTSELAALTDATLILPESLVGLATRTGYPGLGEADFVAECYKAMATHPKLDTKQVLRYTRRPFAAELRDSPPLLSLVVDRARSSDQIVDVLRTLRSDYADLRRLRADFEAELTAAPSDRERFDVVERWKEQWKRLERAEFRSVGGLLRRSLQGGDVVEILTALAKNADDLGKARDDAAPTLLRRLVELLTAARATQRYAAFVRLAEQLGAITDRGEKLRQVFGIERVERQSQAG
jgi:hypothetical protein